MDKMTGQSTNIDKSKILATTRRVRMTARQIEINGTRLNLVHDFKLLGHRCVGIHKFISTDVQEAAIEAKLRTQRIQTLPVGQEGKIRLLKTSAMKVLAAGTQWSRAQMSTLNTLKTEVIRTVWGKRREMRCAEIVLGVLHDCTDLDPLKAMAWTTINNARRLMQKTAKLTNKL